MNRSLYARIESPIDEMREISLVLLLRSLKLLSHLGTLNVIERKRRITIAI